MKLDTPWDFKMANQDVQFEHSIRAIAEKLESVKNGSDSKEVLEELWSELLSAKLRYNNLCEEHGSNYKGGTESLYKAVQELDNLLPKSNDAIVQGIRRQLNEIRKAYRACNGTKDS